MQKGNSLLFAKKYQGNQLEDYLKLRKELLDLKMADQYTKSMVRGQSHQNLEKVQQPKSYDLFSELKIKTKYIKPKVKENIIKALA